MATNRVRRPGHGASATPSSARRRSRACSSNCVTGRVGVCSHTRKHPVGPEGIVLPGAHHGGSSRPASRAGPVACPCGAEASLLAPRWSQSPAMSPRCPAPATRGSWATSRWCLSTSTARAITPRAAGDAQFDRRTARMICTLTACWLKPRAHDAFQRAEDCPRSLATRRTSGTCSDACLTVSSRPGLTVRARHVTRP
jgi:hypothetical protein